MTQTPNYNPAYAQLLCRSRASEPALAQLDAMIAAMDATHPDAQTQQTLKQLYVQHTADIALYR